MPKRIVSKREKEMIIEKISNILMSKKYIIFSYIFGSFATEDNFRDIDIGIHISNIGEISPLKSGLE